MRLSLAVVPFAILAAAAFLLRPSADARTWSILAIGAGGALLPILAAAPWRSADDRPRRDARRVLLRALLATLVLFALCCAWIAANGIDGTLGSWAGIVFLPAWFVFALIVPLWVDSKAVRTDEPRTGWKTFLGLRMIYSDAADDALWIHLSPQLARDAFSVLYTPNLGHRWGRAAMLTFVVLVVAMVLIMVAASRPTGLLP